MIRLRPVLMTSAATICGHFPLTLVSGAGAAARNSIGITVVAGMALGTLFTLLVIPSIYVLIAKQHVGEAGGVLGRDLALAETAPYSISGSVFALRRAIEDRKRAAGVSYCVYVERKGWEGKSRIK